VTPKHCAGQLMQRAAIRWRLIAQRCVVRRVRCAVSPAQQKRLALARALGDIHSAVPFIEHHGVAGRRTARWRPCRCSRHAHPRSEFRESWLVHQDLRPEFLRVGVPVAVAGVAGFDRERWRLHWHTPAQPPPGLEIGRPGCRPASPGRPIRLLGSMSCPVEGLNPLLRWRHIVAQAGNRCRSQGCAPGACG